MTAKDLLLKYLDFKYLWSTPDRVNEQPSKARFQQLEALLGAFGLTKKHVNPLVKIKYRLSGQKEQLDRANYLNSLSNIEYFQKGEFLRDREYSENKELVEIALEKVNRLFEHTPEPRNKERPVDIGWMFNSLLNFRQDIFNVTYPNSGMLEGFNVGLFYSQHLQSELKKSIIENLTDIDKTLVMILDPNAREFELEYLKSEFQYPDIDLKKIDLEWRMDNY